MSITTNNVFILILKTIQVKIVIYYGYIKMKEISKCKVLNYYVKQTVNIYLKIV